MPAVFSHWPNRITALRFLGSLVLFGLLAQLGGRDPREHTLALQLSMWLFILVALTDVLDGWMARHYHHESDFGRIADPFVDKVLVLGAMVFLCALDFTRPWFPAWIVVVVLAREFLVTGIRGYSERMGLPFPADRLGKAKMLFQCHAIGFGIGMHAFPFEGRSFEVLSIITHVLVWATLLTTIASGIAYLIKSRALFAQGAA